MTSEIETYEFNSADAMRVSKPSLLLCLDCPSLVALILGRSSGDFLKVL